MHVYADLFFTLCIATDSFLVISRLYAIFMYISWASVMCDDTFIRSTHNQSDLHERDEQTVSYLKATTEKIHAIVFQAASRIKR